MSNNMGLFSRKLFSLSIYFYGENKRYKPNRRFYGKKVHIISLSPISLEEIYLENYCNYELLKISDDELPNGISIIRHNPYYISIVNNELSNIKYYMIYKKRPVYIINEFM